MGYTREKRSGVRHKRERSAVLAKRHMTVNWGRVKIIRRRKTGRRAREEAGRNKQRREGRKKSKWKKNKCKLSGRHAEVKETRQ